MSYSTVLQSVNVGQPRTLVRGDRETRTGIFKEPVDGAVAIGRLGLTGDAQADLSVHGGVDKAVYAYSLANVAHWREALGRDDLGPGTFGENLSLEDLADEVVALGDELQVGGARLQVTQPRQPCFKLAMKLDLPKFPKTFTRSGRVGFYLRVLEPGEVAAGDTLACVAREASPLSIASLNAALMVRRDDEAGLRRALASPALSASWREAIEGRLGGR